MEKKIRVKIMCHWLSQNQIYGYFNKLSKGNCEWNNIKIVTDDKNVDYYCIINYPKRSTSIKFNKTIYMLGEPKVKINTWFPTNWRNIDKSKFMYFLNRNNIEWHLKKTYTQLMNEDIIKSKVVSGVISDAYNTFGQKKRVDFLKFLDKNNFIYDLYGRGNKFKLKNYKSGLPSHNKNNGILPYKYTFCFENIQESNYFTEKIIDGIVGECLCFYWGCPNIGDFIDTRAIVILDFNDFEKSLEIIKQTIENNEWDKRIDIIKKEKCKILNELQFFPTLEKIINSL